MSEVNYWTVYLRYDKYGDNNLVSKLKYEITFLVIELNWEQKKRIKYIITSSKTTNVTIDFLDVDENKLYSKTFNNKYISELIYQIYHLIDITSSAEALKIEKDSRIYTVKSISNGFYIWLEIL